MPEHRLPRCAMLSGIGDDSSNQPIDLLYVQSTDKNLMVPVGGAVIAGFSTDLVDFVAKLYPGEPSVSTNPVKSPYIRFLSSQFRKQHPRQEK
ncbi:unnamed protein product, partial [Schistosoma mattheei]